MALSSLVELPNTFFLLPPLAFPFALALSLSFFGFTIAAHIPTSEQILPNYTVFVVTL